MDQSSINVLAGLLKSLINNRLKQSKIGAVWHDDETWRSMAGELAAAFSKKFVVLEKKAYDELHEDAAKWRRVRDSVAAYHALKEQTKPAAGEGNWYANWAKNNMKTEEKKP